MHFRMPTDPQSPWNYGPIVEFQFPFDANDAHVPLRSDYRLAAERLLKVLHAIDEVMTHSRQPHRHWREISLALGLPSCRYQQLTEARIGADFGITKMGVSKSIRKLMRLAELKPNGRGFNGRM